MSFPAYPACKDSGVEWLGEVPEHWEVFSLKRTVDGCTNGLWGDEPDGTNDIVVIRVADFDRALSRVGAEKLTYRSITKKERASRLLKSGDLLIEKSGGGERTLVGCVVKFEHDLLAVTSNFVGRMRPLDGFDSGFLCYAFAALYDGKVNYPAIKQTTGIQNLDAEAYLQEQFCFPPKDDQWQIARFLDHETARIDALIAEQQRLIELLKEKRQAVISHAVTKGLDPTVPMKDSGVEWLGEVPAHWEVKRLKHLCADIKAGPFGSALTKDMYVASGYKIYGQEQVIPGDFSIGDYYIDDERFESLRPYQIAAGDILISCVGTFGKIAVVPEDAESGVINPRLIRVRSNHHASPQYLSTVLRSGVVFEQFSVLSRGGTMDVINIGTLSEIVLAVPPLNEQIAILSFTEVQSGRFDGLMLEASGGVSLLKERRSALISAAVTGKIDVRGWQPPFDAATASVP
jgi:type I restriction enzyme S subunit